MRGNRVVNLRIASTVATCPPNRKAEGQRRLLGDMRRRDEIARSMMRPNVAALKEWLSKRSATRRKPGQRQPQQSVRLELSK
jgi:hypothetical protein